MSAEFYAKVSMEIQQIEPKIKQVKDMINVARAAGEDVNALQAQLGTLETKVSSWRSALRAKGY